MKRKFVTLRTQKIILFIPVVNAFLSAIWLYNFLLSKEKLRVMLKSFFLIIPTVIVTGMLCALLAGALPEGSILPMAAMMYGMPFVLGMVLIWYQKKVLWCHIFE